MKIVNKEALDAFKKTHAGARASLNAWESEAQKAEWTMPADVKHQYVSASILKSGNVVFNIAGNKFRLWVKIAYKTRIIYIKNIGTHGQYDKWDIK